VVTVNGQRLVGAAVVDVDTRERVGPWAGWPGEDQGAAASNVRRVIGLLMAWTPFAGCASL
jgi:hypothetical protein